MPIVINRNNVRFNNKTVGGAIRFMAVKPDEKEIDMDLAKDIVIPRIKYVNPHNTIGFTEPVKALHKKIDGGSFLENHSCGKRNPKKRNNISFKLIK